MVPGFLDGTNVRFLGFAKGVCLVFKKNEGKRKVLNLGYGEYIFNCMVSGFVRFV